MMTFREFLEKKGREPNLEEKRQRRADWIDAVTRLVTQLRDWLIEADPDGLLEITPLDVDRVEQGVGRYKVDGLAIALGDTQIKVVPIGRNVVGFVNLGDKTGVRAAGRVDITDGGRKYILYRVVWDGTEHWFAQDDRHDSVPLTHERFDAIMQDLLS